MISLLIKIIPLDLAATLSPGILALVIILLGSKNHPKAKTISLFFGILIAATNFDALFLCFAAAREVGEAGINDFSKIILVIVNLIFYTLPLTLPLFIYLIMPDLAQRMLTKFN